MGKCMLHPNKFLLCHFEICKICIYIAEVFKLYLFKYSYHSQFIIKQWNKRRDWL